MRATRNDFDLMHLHLKAHVHMCIYGILLSDNS